MIRRRSYEGTKASVAKGVVNLEGGRGVLRSSRPLIDYEMQFEFRAAPEANPTLMLRTWLAKRQPSSRSYRLTLPTRQNVDPASLFVARGQKLRVLQLGKVDLRHAGEWQTVKVTAEADRVRVIVNGTTMGEFSVAEASGYVMFENRKGVVELRNIQIRELYGPLCPRRHPR